MQKCILFVVLGIITKSNGKQKSAANEAAAFVKRTEQLYINDLKEMGAKYIDGKIAMAERDEEEEGVDNKGTVVYNNTIHASKKVTKYISYEILGNDVVSFIKRSGQILYGGITMTEYQKGMLVMNYLRKLGTDSAAILDAICDENLERSYRLLQEHPKITKEEFLEEMGIEEN